VACMRYRNFGVYLSMIYGFWLNFR